MSDLGKIETRIASAWAALSGARASSWHSPNADTCAIEDMCERTLDGLLDKLWDGIPDHDRTAIDARPIRQVAPA